MSRPSICALAIVALSICACEDPPPPLLSTLPEPEPLLSLETFCETVFGAPRRHLVARCSAEDKAGKAYAHLVERAGRRVEQCLVDTQLAPSVATGRAWLRLAPALRCAEALERVSWKTTLVSDDLSRFPACGQLVVGAQGERAPCTSSYDCLPGLWCGGTRGGAAGRCRPLAAVGKPCEPVAPTLLGARTSSCRSGTYCRGGATAHPPPSLPRRYEVLGPDGGPASRPAGEAVLAQAAELALTGSGEGQRPPAGVWAGLDLAFGLGAGLAVEPPGLGLAGLGGPGPGFGAGPGHGVSVGRLESSRSAGQPKVRIGDLTVSGRLPDDVVRRILRQHLGRLAHCYEQGLQKNPSLKGRVTVRFVVGRDGVVSSAGASGTLADDGVAQCVAGTLRGQRFPKPEGNLVAVGASIDFAPPPGTTKEPSTAAAGPPAPSALASAAGSAPPRYDESPPGPPVSPSVCAVWQNLGAPCTATDQCAAGLACRVSQCRKPKLARQGEACDDHADCTAGLYCDGTCKKTKGQGQDCTTAAECRGACGAERKCVALCGQG